MTVTASERVLLRLVSEQRGIPIDQLARFLRREEADCEVLVRRLSRRGLTGHGRVLVAEPTWVWLRGSGARAAGTGFPALCPRPGALRRIRAVNEVRLLLAGRAPGARWVCGRSLGREQGMSGTKPSAVLEVGDERHAIVVKQGAPRSSRREWQIARTHMARFDAVIYFVDRRFRRCLEGQCGSDSWPKLRICDLPEPGRGGGGKDRALARRESAGASRREGRNRDRDRLDKA